MISNTGKEDLGKPPSGPPRGKIHKLRDALKHEVEMRQKMLTNREQSFLESIVTNGSEVEIQTALQRLNDISLFFHHHDEEPSGDVESFLSGSKGNCIEMQVDNPLKAIQLPPLKSQQSSASSSVDTGMNRRSSKVLEALEIRKASDIHGQMWRAHETGLSVSNSASRKSTLRRVTSNMTREQIIRNSSFLSSSTRDLLLEGGLTRSQGSDLIFRENSAISLDQKRKELDTLSPLGPKSILRPSDIPSPIGLSKIKSDGIRRSVSFQKTADVNGSQSYLSAISPHSAKGSILREVSDLTLGSDWHSRPAGLSSSLQESGLPTQKIADEKVSSENSFPFIHKAHPIKSESVVESVVTVPSLHRAVPVRSESFASTQDTKLSDSILPSGLGSTDEDVARNETLVGKPILLRMASRNAYHGEGFEATEINDDMENINRARLYSSLLSNGEISTIGSWDETMGRENVFRNRGRSISDDGILPLYLTENNKPMFNDSGISSSSEKPELDTAEGSWDMNSQVDEHPDAWDVLKDPYSIGYGANGTLPFKILGTSADDEASKPHVLSPPLMESLQSFFPYGITEANFWLKYSLIRDGASMHSLLQHIRGAKYTIIAIETSDGEVIGSFTGEPWRKNWSYYGSGESFLWKMRQPRTTVCHSIIDQAHLESELDVYPWTGENDCVQLCTHNTLAVGGGVNNQNSEMKVSDSDDTLENPSFGFGFAIDRQLLHGTSSHCATFGSPPLSRYHTDGSPFEILNLEVWTLTPAYSVEDAEKLELGMLFLSSQ